MKKEIVIKIFVDCEKDEFGNIIHCTGFKDGREIQDRIELIGLLEIIKQQEVFKIMKERTKEK